MQSTICPVCGNDSLELGERCDVGWGTQLGPKVGPDMCPICLFVEAGPDPHDLPLSHYQSCWRKGISPIIEVPSMKYGATDRRYDDWIAANVKDAYGNCFKYCVSLQKAFPELRRIYGLYYCMTWGEREHFWCIDAENNVVDPTSEQFPSKGVGIYKMLRFSDPLDEVELQSNAALDSMQNILT